ncbi:9-O-acetylesterase [Dysgonomonas sp. Marseille-P4677]|uniref:sialate O-acetylesterase n=1 Tax=Dysgonomonas sp. Marseille-P4677 TaxID=2364790 RepID=UPI00191329BF|nr:sialate O-acetylesterase [Dysgonomonas sp. Marseille-P4677]MBK5719663.1 9-O-acetylesterase [Dysgonomonas sp. Marseille-P4677]
MKRKLSTLLICCFSLAISALYAEVQLPRIFSDNMVLQRDKPIKVWGWADKNETVEVRFIDQVKKVKADKNGNWQLQLAPVAYGGPYSMEIKGKLNSITFKNILVGEVWLCSGQSNMEWTVSNVNNATTEIANANYPEIRSFNVIKDLSIKPKTDLEGTWQLCSPETVANFSAVAYFFARKLNKELNIPIGIINSSWGGTDIETWTSPDSFNKLPEAFSERYKNIQITDFDKFVKENGENKEAYLKALQNDPGITEEWFAPSYNSDSWKKMQIPQLWENILPEADGIIWFKYTLNLPSNVEGKAATLQLGAIDDNDITWINGVKVGETEGYSVNRIYKLPANILKAGSNVITVKVTDNTGGGGLYGEQEDLWMEVDGKKYSLAGEWSYQTAVINKDFNYIDLSPNMYPSLLYNAMINPIVNFEIKGTIWYQGENNASQAYNYRTLFPNMINNWRTKWGYEFPFYWVQLANFMAKDITPVESEWAELREAQTMTLSLPKTGEAVITDIGEANDIHPRNKQDVGLRLALNALNKDYGRTDIIYSGPTFKSMDIDGNKAIIHFDNIGKGLYTTNKYGYVEGFAIAGADDKFEWAKAYIEGDKVIVYSNNILTPVSVRYSWSNNPDVNLFNMNGLPAAPFRTDTLKGITQKK